MTVQAIESRGVVESDHRVRLEESLPVRDETVVRVIVFLPEPTETDYGHRSLSPLPELEGSVPSGWKDAIYECRR